MDRAGSCGWWWSRRQRMEPGSGRRQRRPDRPRGPCRRTGRHRPCRRFRGSAGSPESASRQRNRPRSFSACVQQPGARLRRSRSGRWRRCRTGRRCTACRRTKRWHRGSGDRRGPGSCPGWCRQPTAGPGKRRCWLANRRAAERWRNRRRTVLLHGRWPVVRRCRRTRNHRSSACPGSLRRTCWSVPSLELPSPLGWCSFPKRSARCVLPGAELLAPWRQKGRRRTWQWSNHG
ncbi:hypothetical protein D3C81_1585240 [compost metagenome]